MAADSRVNLDTHHFTAKKIKRAKGVLIGTAGDHAQCVAFEAWYFAGGDGKKPIFDESEALVLAPDGVWFFDSLCSAHKIESGIYAIGSGADAARGALMAGATPRQAVQIACAIDSQSGPPITTLKLTVKRNGNKE